MYKILLIDDEPHIRKGLKVIIERGNVEYSKIYEASDGKEGINIINENSPDIIITDIKMPFVDGLELIKWVHNNLKRQPVIIVISGYDDFNYARKAMHYGVQEYLLKPVSREELIRVINNFIHQIKNNEQKYKSAHLQYVQSKEGVQALKEKYLNILITSCNDDMKKGIIDELNRVGVDFRKDLFNLIVVDYRMSNGRTRDTVNNVKRFAINNIVEEVFRNGSMDYFVFYDSQKRMVILLWANVPLLQEIQIKKAYHNIKLNLKKDLNMEVFWGVCSDIEDFLKINDAYEIALNSVMNKIFLPSESIVFNKKPVEDHNIYFYFNSYFSKISSEVELGRKRNIVNLLDDCFKNLKNKNLSANKYENFYNYFNNDIYNHFVKKGINIDAIFRDGETFFRNFDLFWSLDEIKIYMRVYLFNISNIITAYKKSSVDIKLIDQVIQYLNENYNDNINLNTVSDYFEKNNSYLSVLFKKATGEKFIDFLTNIRIEKAKKLLLDLDNKVSDIANQVGYTNPKHFNVVFKKVVGMTPRQFRNKVNSKYYVRLSSSGQQSINPNSINFRIE